jgi:hypothetical protein
MVPRVSRPGRSFTGAWAYYFHDKRTPRRSSAGKAVHTAAGRRGVHVENLGGIEDVRAAVGLMIDTAGKAALRKAGLCVLLGWHPDEEAPDAREMIEAGAGGVEGSGDAGASSLDVAHTDTAHPHVHVIVNRVHPDTGKAINLYKDKKSSRRGRSNYERAHGKVYCRRGSSTHWRGRRPRSRTAGPRRAGTRTTRLPSAGARSDSGRSFKAALGGQGLGTGEGRPERRRF